MFPPAWRAGDRWRVVVHEQKRSAAAVQDPYHVQRTGFLFEVVEEPDGPDGEYLLDIRRFFLPEELERILPERRALASPREHFSARFWARDGSLVWVRDQERDAGAPGAEVKNGPHPFVDTTVVTPTELTPPPVHAYPALPLGLENPLVYAFDGPEGSARGWQRITPTEDGVIIEISQIDLTQGEPAGQSGARLVWRRGDPWWSLHTSVAFTETRGAGTQDVVDGHEVLGRLLRDEP